MIKEYPIKLDLKDLEGDLRHLLRTEAYQVELFPAASGFLLEAKKTGGLRDFSGLSAAVVVSARTELGGTSIELKAQRILDKVVLGLVFLVVFLPLAFFPVYGYYTQHKVSERLWSIIGRHVQKAAQLLP